MTREEAILCLKGMKNYARDTFTEQTDWQTSLNMAIKALEQDPILDNIRAEINLKQYDFMSDKDYNEGIRFGLRTALEIIDKYKAESENN